MDTLETKRLGLRPFTKDDVESYHALYWLIASNHRDAHSQGDEHPNVDEIRSENEYYLGLTNYPFLQPFGRWMVILKAEQQNIGVCHLMPQLFTPDEVELCIEPHNHKLRFGAFEIIIGCALTTPYRGYGYATEAAQAIITYGFETLKLQRILACTDPANTASINTTKKAGMEIVSPPDAKQVISIIENDYPLKI